MKKKTFYSDRHKICELYANWMKAFDKYWSFRQDFIDKYGVANVPKGAL